MLQITFTVKFALPTGPANDKAGTLKATDVAGVPAVAQANWNNLSLLNGTSTTIVGDAAGVSQPTTATVKWNSNNTWSTLGRGETNNAFTGADQTLMLGYLDTGDATTAEVTITGVPEALTAKGYDVYVYAVGGVGAKGGAYRILDADTKEVLKDYVQAQCPTNNATYVQVVPSADPRVWVTGNYIVFSGLNAANIVVQATTAGGKAFGSTPRAPMNAIQLIAPASSTPPPAKPKLSIAKTEAGVSITFTGTLQSADVVTGPYTDVAGASSPYSVPLTGSAKFYRAKN